MEGSVVGVLCQQLSDMRHVSIVSETKAERIGALLREGVDIAVVNVTEGLDLVRRIAALSPDCKIIGVGEAGDADAVIEAMNAGCRQFVQQPATIEVIRGAIEAAMTSGVSSESKRVCVIGSGGASGATTVACHLAAEFAELGGSASIVDLDLEMGNVATALDLEPRHCLADCQGDVDGAVLSNVLAQSGQVSVLSRPRDIGQVESVTPESLDSVLMAMGAMFPYVVVDMSRPNGELGQVALRDADYVVIVAQANVMSMRNACRAKQAAEAAGVDPARIRLVLNRCGSNGLKVTESDAAGTFGADALAEVPNDWFAVREALDMGQLLPDKSPASVAIRRAARELVGAEPVAAPAKRRFRLFARSC